jgi:predicted nucleotidyltransferase
VPRRGNAASDVDLLIEFARPVGLLHFVRVKRHLERILGTRVDLVTRGALKPQLRDAILREAVRAA